MIIIIFASFVGFLLVYYHCEDFKLSISSLLLILVPFSVSLILAIGFGYYTLPERGYFMIDFALFILVIVILIEIAKSILFIFIRITGSDNKGFCLYFSFASILMLIYLYQIISKNINVNKIHYFEVLEDLISNKYQDYFASWKNVMQLLEQNRGNPTVQVPELSCQLKHIFKFNYGGQDAFFNIKKIIIENK